MEQNRDLYKSTTGSQLTKILADVLCLSLEHQIPGKAKFNKGAAVFYYFIKSTTVAPELTLHREHKSQDASIVSQGQKSHLSAM